VSVRYSPFPRVESRPSAVNVRGLVSVRYRRGSRVTRYGGASFTRGGRVTQCARTQDPPKTNLESTTNPNDLGEEATQSS
jgi:hypothetical protein